MKRLLAMASTVLWSASAVAQPLVDPASVTWEGIIGLALFGAALWLLALVLALLSSLFKWVKARIKTWVEGWED